MLRPLRLASACALAIVLATPSVALAARDGDPKRPWGRGTLMPTFGFGLGLGRDATQIGLGVGVRYFVVGGLGVGLSLSDSITIFSESLKSEFPGLTKRIPTNTFRITPSLQYVFYRSRWFSPYVHAGVGPSIFNNGRGVVGHWVAGPGAYIGIGGPVYLNVGVEFSSMFPSGKCNRAYRYSGDTPDVQFDGFCGFNWGPNLGIVVAFGGGRSKRRAAPASPPPNPMRGAYDPFPDDAPLADPSSVPAGEPHSPESAPIEGPPPAGPTPAGPTPVGPMPEGPMPEGPTPEGPTPAGPTPAVEASAPADPGHGG